ncbi:LssY C-terminal domain-containing protein [Nocardioides sp. cx-173]|uniref:LssY C-terminal domain-containing protein n=1 Tax=Nocardioides sp. cx-173 TaxID=2898796 RepID=UPI001E2DAC67|nr:LssY C-terminal domain-containing protein [Nocardioides sp. cx-173]MCD4523523.1 LssY C-terminal domain-containing protein [Nocardioides sp. cx-173]UGB42139.1 LssY C-terminal domain-containing protein [Nocardioides sp. cx-173]
MPSTSRHDRVLSWSALLDGWFYALSCVTGLWFAFVLLRDGVRPGWPTLLLVVFWLFLSYLVLPRLHRILTSIYLPGYFVGRTRTSDGLLGDPVNLGFLGDAAQVHGAMMRAGWTLADELDVRSAWGIVRGVLRGRSYVGAPVSPLHLFDRKQDFAYEQEVAGSPTRRHHIRFWRCPDGWLLPGGFRADWLGAATFDRRVGLSLFTLQFTHRIEEDTDVERDFVVARVCAAVPGVRVGVIEKFSSGYHHRNGGGDRIRTDGDLPILDLRATSPGPGAAVATSTPAQTAAATLLARVRSAPETVLVGGGIALARATTYGVGATLYAVQERVTPLVVAVIALAVCEATLALTVLAGHNWARLLLTAGCSVTAVVSMVGSVVGHTPPVGIGQLLTAGGSILVLMALSSQQAREYATGRAYGAASGAAPLETNPAPAPSPGETRPEVRR